MCCAYQHTDTLEALWCYASCSQFVQSYIALFLCKCDERIERQPLQYQCTIGASFSAIHLKSNHFKQLAQQMLCFPSSFKQVLHGNILHLVLAFRTFSTASGVNSFLTDFTSSTSSMQAERTNSG